jgi:predicted porin
LGARDAPQRPSKRGAARLMMNVSVRLHKNVAEMIERLPGLVPLCLAIASTGVDAQGPTGSSSVTLYGIVDAAVEYSNADANTTSSGRGEAGLRLIDGGHSPSRVGLRGREDLGDGLAAIFTIEHGFRADTGDAAGGTSASNGQVQFWNRQAWVGLEGRWGALTAGRQYTLLWDTLIATDPTGFGFYENVSKLFNNRVDNSVLYRSPTVAGGLTGYAMYAFGETLSAGAPSTDAWGLGVRWAYGAFIGGASYMRYAQPAGPDRSEAGIGGSWRFGPSSQIGGGFIRTDLSSGSDVDQYYVSGSHAVLGGVVYLNYQYVEPAGADSRQQLGLAYSHSLSKRTSAYVALGMLTDVPSATSGPQDPVRIAVGARHLF